MSPRAQSSRKKSSGGTGCLVWLALILFICLLFFVNRGKIEEVLKNTDFVNLIKNRTLQPSATPKRSPGPAVPAASPTAKPIRSAAPLAEPTEEPAKRPTPAPTKSPRTTERPTPRPTAGVSGGELPKQRIATLFFVRVEDDGSIVRQEVKRSIPVSDSPLTDALNALMRGPSSDELSRGYVSLVPQGSKILSVTMRGATAEINFNDAFQFNSLGIEGYAGQLKQVVWTATAFNNVHDVQILIDGKKVDYMGGEGVFIKLPLSRNSF
jgi:spore germination protein GerM